MMRFSHTGSYHLYRFLLLGAVFGLFLGACICMVMEQVLGLQPSETVILLASAGWCGVLAFFARLLYLGVNHAK